MARKIPAKRAARPNPREERNQYRPPTSDDCRYKVQKVEIVPRNLAQEFYLDCLFDPRRHVVFAMGPAGCGKTLLATQYAIQGLQSSTFQKIIITRPTVSVDESYGYLPGNLIDKLAPWVIPITDIFKQHFTVQQLEMMIKNELVEVAPLGFMRGRAQPLDSVIQTPLGPRRMGDIKIGDTVLGSNGGNTEVTGVFPQGLKKIYRVGFSDGVTTLASGDHLWLTQSRSESKHGRGYSVKTTEEILKSGVRKFQYRNHEIPIMSAPAEFTVDYELPIDSYLLGLLLGDGCLNDLAMSFTTADAELVDAVSGGGNKNALKVALRELELSGCRSYEKSIPKEYLYARSEDRIAMLQGLMDTDGTIWKQKDRNPRMQFSSTSQQLTNDVAFLVRSLGGTATTHERIYDLAETRTDRPIHHRRNSFIVDMNLPPGVQPFRLSRNATKFTGSRRVYRFIDSIEEIGDMPCQCISVSANDHLYLTDDFIVTHNTLKNAAIIFDEAQNATPNQMKMMLTRLGEGSKMVVTGDLRQHDRGYEDNGLKDFIERLRKKGSTTISVCEFSNRDVERHPVIEEVLNIYGD